MDICVGYNPVAQVCYGTHRVSPYPKHYRWILLHSQSLRFEGRRKRGWYLRAGRGRLLSFPFHVTASSTLRYPNGLDPLTISAENAGWDLLWARSFLLFSFSLYLILHSSRFAISYMFLRQGTGNPK
jgi:hypothetical protein